MLTFLEVNGAATEASAIESEMPEKMKFSENIHIMEIVAILTTIDVGCCANLPGKSYLVQHPYCAFLVEEDLPAWAVFNAPQSLQPSPHMMTCRLHFKSKFMSKHKILILIHIKI